MPREDAPLRIGLICGCLEPGRDGVGDYTRSLARQLSHMGHRVAVAAIRDPHVNEGAVDRSDMGDVPILRVHDLREPRASEALTDHFAQLDPQWLSLQFVPWSFADRGVVLRLGHDLRGRWDRPRWHVMFHELWVLAPDRARRHALGMVQRWSIRRTLRQIGPAVVHVSVLENAARLQTLGSTAQVLPMFGSIPVAQTDRASLDAPRGTTILFFGALARPEEWDAVLNELGDFSRECPSSLRVVLAGGPEGTRREFLAALKTVLPGASVDDVGFLGPSDVSALMLASTVGVVRNPASGMGKSSSVMAMLEHGLPVWAPMLGNADPDLRYRPDRIFPRLRDAAAAGSVSAASQLPVVADQLVRDLMGREPGALTATP